MKTNELTITELSNEEMTNTNGGFISLPGLALMIIIPAIILLPIAAAVYRGYNDYQTQPK